MATTVNVSVTSSTGQRWTSLPGLTWRNATDSWRDLPSTSTFQLDVDETINVAESPSVGIPGAEPVIHNQNFIERIDFIHDDEDIPGGNFVRNGDFSVDEHWTKLASTNQNISGGRANWDGNQPNISYYFQDNAVNPNAYIEISYEVVNRTRGNFRIALGDGTGSQSGIPRNSDGQYLEYFRAADSSRLLLQASRNFTGSVDNIYVRLLGDQFSTTDNIIRSLNESETISISESSDIASPDAQLTLTDAELNGLQPDFLGLIRIDPPPSVYGIAGVGELIDGELGLGPNNIPFSLIRFRDRTAADGGGGELVAFNENDPNFDIGEHFRAGGDGNALTILIQTAEWSVHIPVENNIFNTGANFAVINTTDAQQALIGQLEGGETILFGGLLPSTGQVLTLNISESFSITESSDIAVPVLTLADAELGGRTPDFLGLIRVGSLPSIYGIPPRENVGELVDGELGIGPDNEPLTLIRFRSATSGSQAGTEIVAINDSGGFDIGQYYRVGGVGHDSTILIQTLAGHILLPIDQHVGNTGGNFTTILVDDDQQSFIGSIQVGDLILFGALLPETSPTISLTESESFSISETSDISESSVLTLSQSESLTVADDTNLDTFDRNYSFDDPESFSFIETFEIGIIRNYELNRSESFSIDEQSSIIEDDNIVTLDQRESFSFIESIQQAVSQGLLIAESESFSIAEEASINTAGNTLTLTQSENFSIGEQSVRDITTPAITLTLNQQESVSFNETYNSGSSIAVLSDLVVSNGDIAISDFQNMLRNGKPAGHSEFVKYIPGDYMYREAIYRVKIISNSPQDRVRFTKLKLEVDVPDIIETGTSTINNASAGAVITFNKIFHIVPDITVSFRGGNSVGSAEYSAESKTGFIVHLRDFTGALTVGTVSWAVRGY